MAQFARKGSQLGLDVKQEMSGALGTETTRSEALDGPDAADRRKKPSGLRRLLAFLTCRPVLDDEYDHQQTAVGLQQLAQPPKARPDSSSHAKTTNHSFSDVATHNVMVDNSSDSPNEAASVKSSVKSSESLDKPVPPTPAEPGLESEPSKDVQRIADELEVATLGTADWLLAPVDDQLRGRKCLVLDLDETLVHSSFKYIHQADFVIPVEIETQFHNVYVIKRPGVDEFMRRMGELFEVVVFTASVSKYGDPLLDQLDLHQVVHHRLFREACFHFRGNYIKNLSRLGRPLNDVIIIDNSPASYIFHTEHAIPVSSWFSDAHDNELLDMVPFLEDLAKVHVSDVRHVLDVKIDPHLEEDE